MTTISLPSNPSAIEAKTALPTESYTRNSVDRSGSDTTLFVEDKEMEKQSSMTEEPQKVREIPPGRSPSPTTHDIHLPSSPASGTKVSMVSEPISGTESLSKKAMREEIPEDSRKDSSSSPRTVKADQTDSYMEQPAAPEIRSEKLEDHQPFLFRNMHRQKKKVEKENNSRTPLNKNTKDGRLDISVDNKLHTGLVSILHGAKDSHLRASQTAVNGNKDLYVPQSLKSIPILNIVIMVIGSRGDIQPFLKIGKILQEKYHHRVRIATHPVFKKFVEDDIGLEFFSVGGDPSELMAFMVKNPGLIPSLETVKAGEVGRRRDSMFEMFQGFWRACINTTDDEKDLANLDMMQSKHPFVADAIIANPPSFAHYHCAEKLNIPLHLVFTFPYSPTQSFPHPLANVKSTNIDQSHTNFMSYSLVDHMTWQGLGDIVNRFRVQTLGLEPVSKLWAPGQLSRLKVPTTYLWSPGLVPKPSDWGPEISIAGYVFLDLATKYHPPQDLSKFLERSDGKAIIYIGFGSISGISDPTAFTKMVFEGVEKAGVRAIISKGWGGMGEGLDKPDGVFLIDNVPHDWLFPKVDAVIHHGGAGTTAAGLKFGKPTMIVPFFGDQPFWSAMVAKAGAGAKEGLPLKSLDSDKFAEGICQCLEPEAKAKAQEIAQSIELEGDGAENAIDAFHQTLPYAKDLSTRCWIFDDRVAVWTVNETDIQLSALAAHLLVEKKQLLWSDLHLKKHVQWTGFQAPGGPLTGAGGALFSAFQEAIHGIHSIPGKTKHDITKYNQERRTGLGYSVAQAIVLPGRFALASRGTTTQHMRRETAVLEAEFNFHGSAEPFKHLFGASKNKNTSMDDPQFAPNLAESCEATSVPVIVMKDVAEGVGHSAKAIITLPIDVFNALALGFHNGPRIYGDKTVRRQPQSITGFRSGVQAAGSEVWLGFYDGVTGLVRIPYQDFREDGVAGIPAGVARALAGLVMKPLSGILGLGAYTGKGLHASVRNYFRDTQRTERWIRRVRVNQGTTEVLMIQQESEETKPDSISEHPQPVGLENLQQQAVEHWMMHQKQMQQRAREGDLGRAKFFRHRSRQDHGERRTNRTDE